MLKKNYILCNYFWSLRLSVLLHSPLLLHSPSYRVLYTLFLELYILSNLVLNQFYEVTMWFCYYSHFVHKNIKAQRAKVI